MISRKAVGTRMNSAVAINARILTSIISSFFLLHHNSGFGPIERLNLLPLFKFNKKYLDYLEFDQYHE